MNRPYSSRFRTELDFTEELGEELTNIYQKLIVVMMWPTEIGRVSILAEVIFYLGTCVPQERDTLILFIVSSGIYRITWVRTQG